MAGRGTTVVAWAIGLGVLVGQAVMMPIAAAMVEDRAPTPIEVTAPALPAVQRAEPAVEVGECGKGMEIPARVIALIG